MEGEEKGGRERRRKGGRGREEAKEGVGEEGGREGRMEKGKEGGGRDGERKVGRVKRGRKEEKKEGERLTSAMVTLAAFAMGTLKFLADFLKMRFPLLSAFHALMRAKSAKMASSIM